MFEPRRTHSLCNPCSAVPNVKNCISMLTPFLRRKGSGKVGHSSKRVNNARMRALIA